MWSYLAAVLGGLNPRRRARPAEPPRIFQRVPAVQHLRAVVVGPGGVWVACDKGLLDLNRDHLLELPLDRDPEGAGLTHLAQGRFLVAGGPSGLWVLAGRRLDPVEPGEAVRSLSAWGSGVAALTGAPGETVRLRRAWGPSKPWHCLWEGPENVRALAVEGDGAWVGGDRLWRVGPRGQVLELPLPEGCEGVEELAFVDDRLMVSGGGTWCRELGTSQWGKVEPSGSPGSFGGEAAVGNSAGITTLAGRTVAAPDGSPKEPLRPAGQASEGGGLALTPTRLLRAGRRKWRPLLEVGRVPGGLVAARATRGGALWCRDPSGALFHRAPSGEWTRLLLPSDFRGLPGAFGVDGEALLISGRSGAEAPANAGSEARGPTASGDAEAKPDDRLFWIGAPRGEEQGTLLDRTPRPVSLGPLSGRDVATAEGLAGAVYAGVGSRLVRSRDGVVDVWGPAEGLPEREVVAVAPLYDDLWAVFAGEGGPRRFGQAVPEPDPVPDSGPSGMAVSLTPDEDSGQLWVAFADGARGGVASISREGNWITQLRLPAPVVGVAAAKGSVLASGAAGLYLLEEGERRRRAFGPEDGLPARPCGVVAFAGPVALVDSAGSLFQSNPERWSPPERAEDMRV